METQAKWQTALGWVLTGAVGLFLLLDAAMKLMRVKVAVDGTMQLGYPDGVLVPLGIVLLAGTLLYLIPRTALLGAILLTGYLGGATATHVRVAQPFLFPVIFGVVVWAGIYLRSERLRSLFWQGA